MALPKGQHENPVYVSSKVILTLPNIFYKYLALYCWASFREVSLSNAKDVFYFPGGITLLRDFVICVLFLILKLLCFSSVIQDKVDDARAILARIYPANEVENEMEALRQSVEEEKAEAAALGNGFFTRIKRALSNIVFRRALYAGITCQVVQQFCGINTVMYYSPTIVQFAGFASKQTALALSLTTSGLNVVGTVISMCCIDRYGRRMLQIISLIGIIICLVALSGVFYQAANSAPPISGLESTHFGGNSTCPAYITDHTSASWNCMKCLKVGCAFCANKADVVSFINLNWQCLALVRKILV